MKFLPAFMLLSALAASSQAIEVRFFLGTYTGKKSQGIYVGGLDTETGKLSPLALAAESKNPSFLAISPDGKHLYAALEAGSGGVGAFAIGSDGKLTLLNEQSSGSDGACHVSVDQTSQNVLVANYGGGSIASFRVKPDGALGDRTAFIRLTGNGPDKQRQEKPHAHSIYPDPQNRFVYACDLGTDNVWIYKFDSAAGTLAPNDPASGKVPPGAGPRHFAIHPNGSLAYANNEMALSVTAFSRDMARGGLNDLQTISTLPEDAPRKGASTAEIFCHPSGKWLYVSNRGHDSVAVFAIAADGKLSSIENAPAHVKMPRGFAIDPSGRWLITAGQDDDRIAVLKIDQSTGKLTPTDQIAEVGSPVCVVFAPVP